VVDHQKYIRMNVINGADGRKNSNIIYISTPMNTGIFKKSWRRLNNNKQTSNVKKNMII